jgi:hypothetical protein
MADESPVTQWMVDQLVRPEVQSQIAETYKGIPMDSVRLAWPFKTEAEREILRKFLNKKTRAERKHLLDNTEKALM